MATNTDDSSYQYVLVEVYDNYVSAHIALGRLEEDGINCWLKDENTVTIDPILTNAIGGIKLMVVSTQAERAKDILAKIAADHKASQVCPNCRSHNIMLITSPRKPSNWLGAIAGFFFGDFALGITKTYRCFDCTHEFKEPVDLKAGGQGGSSD